MSKTQAKLLLISVFAARGTSFLFSKNLKLYNVRTNLHKFE